MKKNKHGRTYKESAGGYYRLFDKVRATRFSTPALIDLANALDEKEVFFGLVDRSRIPAGLTYLGQFIDHDITRMRRLSDIPKDGPVDVNKLVQEHTPMLDLDSLYGGGLGSSKVPYTEHGKFYSEFSYSNGLFYDVPRSKEKGKFKPLIGDDRNDENLIICQLHVLFMNLHNKLIDLHYAGAEPYFPKLEKSELDINSAEEETSILAEKISNFERIREEVFAKVRREVTLIYQSVVVNDFLHNLLDEQVRDYLFTGVREDKERLASRAPCEEIQIPVEFSGAAFRFGHSLVRNGYLINNRHKQLNLKKLLSLTGKGQLDGNNNLSQFTVDWTLFFNMGNGTRVKNETTIFRPFVVEGLRLLLNEVPGNRDLLSRNLLRGKELGLPCAQDTVNYIINEHPEYAAAVGLDCPISPDDICKFPQNYHTPKYNGKVGAKFSKYGFHKKTPLWAYILLEPRIAGTGLSRLGKLGSIIIGETFRSLLDSSETSVFDPSIVWDSLEICKSTQPRSGSSSNWTMADIVNFVNSD